MMIRSAQKLVLDSHLHRSDGHTVYLLFATIYNLQPEVAL